MKTLPLENSGAISLAEAVKMAADGEPVLLTQGGEGCYVLGAVDDLEWEAFSLSRNPKFMTYLESCRERARREGSISLEEAKRELALE